MKNLINPYRSDPNQTARSFQNFLAGAPHGLDWKAAFTGPKLANSCVLLCLLLQPHLDEMFYGLRQQNSETESAFTQWIPPAPRSGHRFNLEHLTAEVHTQNDPPFSANHFNIKISYPPQASYTRLSLPGLGLKSTIVPLEHLWNFSARERRPPASNENV